MSIINAANAREIMKASNISKCSEEASVKILEAISNEISKAAKKCEKEIILSEGMSYPEPAEDLYYHPWKAVQGATAEAAQDIIDRELKKNGFDLYHYYNGQSHLKISWGEC